MVDSASGADAADGASHADPTAAVAEGSYRGRAHPPVVAWDVSLRGRSVVPMSPGAGRGPGGGGLGAVSEKSPQAPV
jgi:hypothetical protein